MTANPIHTQQPLLHSASSEDRPLISVAMPVYNAGPYLAASIKSILDQTYTNFELILVNDSSTDASKEIIESFRDARIRYFENSENMGIAYTRNQCLVHAEGKYIAVLDNDDLAHPRRLEKQIDFLEKHPDFSLCGSFWTIIDEDGKKVARVRTPVEDEEIKTYLLFNNCFCNSSIMIRSRILKEFMYPEQYSMIEDYYFLYKSRQHSKMAILPESLTLYRVHGRNTSIRKIESMRKLRRKMDAMILRDIGIPHSEYQLELHSALLNSNYEFLSVRSKTRDLESWLLVLHRKLKAAGEYDMKVVERILIRRWLSLLARNKWKLTRILFNRLAGRTGIRYFGYLWEAIREKFSRRIHLS